MNKKPIMKNCKSFLFGVVSFLLLTLLCIAPSYTQDSGVRLPEEESAKASVQKAEKSDEELLYLNFQDEDIRNVIKQISKATGKNFIIDDGIRGKITIISERMMTKEEAYQTFLSALEVSKYTVVSGPGGILKIVKTSLASKSPIPIHVDTTPYTDSFVTRLISLQNISANDIQKIIDNMVSKEGNVFAYPATNTLIITDSGTNIDRLMKLIKELDQEGPQQVLDIINIRYADAKELTQTIMSLFEIDAKKTTTSSRRRSRKTSQPELEELEEVSKIIADDRTNSIIVLASTRGIKKVKEIIHKMDQPLTGREGKIHVHRLEHASATELAQTLSALTSGASGSRSKKAGDKQSFSAQLEGGINIVADETTNSLIITASHKDYNTLKKELLNKLDIPRRQVYLEAIVMELKLSKGLDYSISGHGGKYFGSFMPFGQTFGSLSNLFSPTSFFGASGLLGGVLSRDTVNIDVPSEGGGTTTFSIPAFSIFLNLIQNYTDANVVSSPNILTLDNQEAEINIIEKIYAPKTTTTATGIVTTEPIPLEAGLTLNIKPQISAGNSVRLEINHELSNFEGRPTKEQPTPPTTSRKIKTTVVAMDGQTVVLGGLMQDLVASTKSKIPVLGDIPILGWLFKTTSSTKRKTNLLVFITPHIIDDPTDFSKITKRKLNERNRFIDENYGKRQQKAIKKVLAAHRADLLEYAPPQKDFTEGASASKPVFTTDGKQATTNYSSSSQPTGKKSPPATIGSPSTPSKPQDIDLGY